MKIIFAGTPKFAADQLQFVLDKSRHEVIAVYTQPDRKAGRGKKIQASPVKELAERHELTIHQPTTLSIEHEKKIIFDLDPDIILTVAYGLLLPKDIIKIPRFGAINVHASLLPKWRGAAPIERAILSGDKETGITIMQMDEGLDTGDMIIKKHCKISEKDTGDSLKAKLTIIGKELLLESLNAIENRSISLTKQIENQSSYAKKINKKEGLINWDEPAIFIERKIRAFTSSIPSYTFLNEHRVRITKANISTERLSGDSNINGQIIKVSDNYITVQCDKSCLEITEVQIPGTNPMMIKELLNGRPKFFFQGQILKNQNINCEK